MDILKLLARFSPRLQDLLKLTVEVEKVFTGVEDLIHDKGSDPKVQHVLNDMADVRRVLKRLRSSY